MFALLQQFIAQFKHANVPQKLADPNYPRLGSWIHTQRTAMRFEKMRKDGRHVKGGKRINAEQIRMLEEVGFKWVAPPRPKRAK